MQVYLHSVTREGKQLTVAYQVRKDDGTPMSGLDPNWRTVSASGSKATLSNVKQLAFRDALDYERAEQAAAALIPLVGTYNVPNSTMKVKVNFIARLTDEPLVEINYKILDADNVTVYGPTAVAFGNVENLTREFIKEKAFAHAREIEVAVATEQALVGAVGKEIAVE